MNGPIRKVSIFVAVLFAALLINLTYTAVARQEPLLENPLNRRVRDAEFSRDRGAILVGNDAVALSEPSGHSSIPYARTYPDGDVFAPVTGWFTRIHGVSGLEQQYSTELAGTHSGQTMSRLVDILTGRSPSGANLHTTIDDDAQRAAMRALGDSRGAVVALDYTSGAILALASTPSYDPNSLATLDTNAEIKQWNQLLESPEEPLKNRASREVYPPGSTFKLITAAAAIENGVQPSDVIPSPASLRLPKSSHSMGNSTNCGGDTTTLEHALAVSCNTAFGQLGIDLGPSVMQDMAERFGFNQKQTIDIQAATSRYPAQADEAQTALSAIGQFEVAASPLQMAQVTGAIANDGSLMQPHLVSEVSTRDLQVIRSHTPKELSRPISEATAKQLQAMMVETVKNGTGRPARVDGVTIGGKTGTAQSSPDRPNYAWFVGYAEDPQVAIAVFIEDAGVANDDISGGRLAAPVFRAVLEALR